MIKSPKEKFQSSQIRTGQWANVVSTPIFDEACDAALLQLQESRWVANITSQGAADYHQQMMGAQSLIFTLKTLHETTQEPKKETRQGLNYQAGV